MAACSSRYRHWRSQLADFGLGIIFLYSSITHFQNPYSFLDAVNNYSLIPADWVAWVTVCLNFCTMTAGISLVSGVLSGGGRLVAVGLLTIFLVAQVSTLCRGMDVACGCFGTRGERIGLLTVARTVALLVLAVFAIYSDKSESRDVPTESKW